VKLKKNTTYDAIYFSDIHYLIEKRVKAHNHKALFQLLDHLIEKNIKAKKIFLVGDIIESWYFDSSRKLKKSKKKFNKLFDRLDAIEATDGEKYYLIGNHDTTSFRGNLSPKISIYLTNRNWNILDQYINKKMIIAHGHQGQYGKFFWFIAISSVRFLYFLSKIIPNLMKKVDYLNENYLNFDRQSTAEDRIKYYLKLSKKFNQQDRWLICGHTHQFLVEKNLKIINTGDWISSNTFLLQMNDKVLGINFNSTASQSLSVDNDKKESCLTLEFEIAL